MRSQITEPWDWDEINTKNTAIELPPQQLNASELEKLQRKVYSLDKQSNTLYRCEACPSMKSSCKEKWGNTYVPVNFSHNRFGALVDDPQNIELMLLGFGPGPGSDLKAIKQSSNLFLNHSAPFGLPANIGSSNPLLKVIGYLNEEEGTERFKLGRNVHLTNLIKCRTEGTDIREYVMEANNCYLQFLQEEIVNLPSLKAIVMFFPQQIIKSGSLSDGLKNLLSVGKLDGGKSLERSNLSTQHKGIAGNIFCIRMHHPAWLNYKKEEDGKEHYQPLCRLVLQAINSSTNNPN